MSLDGRLEAVGVSTAQWWLLVGGRAGVDFEFNPLEVADSMWPQDAGLSVDLQHMTATVRSRNSEAYLELLSDDNISLKLVLKDRWISSLPI